MSNLPIESQNTRNLIEDTSPFYTSREVLDESRNLTLEKSDDVQFLEIFFQLEIKGNSKGNNLSEHTLKAYKNDAQTLFNFIERHNLKLKNIGFPEVAAYNRYINDNFAIRTCIRKLQFFKRLLKFGYRTNFYKSDFSVWIEKPKSIKGHYSSDDIEGIQNKKPAHLRELDQESAYAIALCFELVVKNIKRNEPYIEFLNKRNLFIGYLLYSTGMRASEIINLDFYHFRNKRGVIYIDVIGKGNKPRKVPLDGENSVEAFEDYQEVVSQYLKRYMPKMDIEDVPLLFSPITLAVEKKISRMSYYTLYKIVKQSVAKSVEIARTFKAEPDSLTRKEKKIGRLLKNILPLSAKEGVISPHWFRHTFVTMLLENDVPLAVVKDLVGHADISTTNIYLEKIKEEKKHEHLSNLRHLGF